MRVFLLKQHLYVPPPRDGNTGHLSKVNLCQILVEREPHCTMPTTQQLLTKCFVSQNLSFDRQPDVLLLQVQSQPPPNTAPPLTASPNTAPIPPLIFKSRIYFSWLYMDPFINERTKYPLFVSRTLDFYFRKPIVGRNII